MTTMETVKSTAIVVADDVRDFVRSRARSLPPLDDRQREILATLRRDGYAVVPGYWTRERALEMRDRLERYLAEGESKDFPSGARMRFWDNQSYDQGVRRIYHVDREEPDLREFRHDPWIMRIAEAYYRIPFHSGALVFQHNLQSNYETRYYHVDAFSREFKAFLYLDDVSEGNGPFTYLPGTHRRHFTRLRKQIVGNKEGSPTSFYPEDLGDALEHEEKIEGPAGTLILSDVRGLHRGSPQQSGSRSVLVNYMYKHEGDVELE